MIKNRTLIVSIVDFPEGLAHTQFIKKFANLFRLITKYVDVLIAYPPGIVSNNTQNKISINNINYHYYRADTPQNTIKRLLYRIFSQIFYYKQIYFYRSQIKYVVLIGTTFYDDLIFILFKYIYKYKIIYIITDDVSLLLDGIENKNSIKAYIIRFKYLLIILQMYSFKFTHPFIITVSMYLKKFINSFIAEENIVIIPTICPDSINDIEIKKYFKYDIVYAGNIAKFESLDFFIEALLILKQSYNKKLNVAIFGAHNGNKNEVEELKNKIITYNLDDIIVINNIVSKHQLDEIFKSSRILVLPRNDIKINRAGFSGKVVDYMLSGRPVVATDVGDISYYYNNGSEIILSPAGDKIKFAECLVSLLNDENLSNAIGINGYNKTIDLFSIQRIKNEILRVIDY